MKRYEKESFLKSFLLFFITLLTLNSIIFTFYYHEQKTTLHERIFQQIKLYNYTFENKNIQMDIVPFKTIEDLYNLNIKENQVYVFFDIPNSKKNSLKLSFNTKIYQEYLHDIISKTTFLFLVSSFILLGLSLLYSWYALRPLKSALYLLEEFLKDIIHDLNTPITSILLNLKILEKKPSLKSIERIRYSAKNISSLYGNLEATIKNEPLIIEEIELKTLLEEKIKYYQYLYPLLHFHLDIQMHSVESSLKDFSRILDNLISNACKYNIPKGSIFISTEKNKITIKDTGIGIKNSQKVFERFYKESERGLGIGLNIVEKLCKKLKIKIAIYSQEDEGTTVELTLS